MSRLRNLQSNADRWGWRRALLHSLFRGAERYLGIHIYVVRCRPIPSEPTYPASNPKLHYRQIEEAELTQLTSDPDLFLASEFVAGAIDRGDLAYGAYDEDKLVSYIWRSCSSAPDTDGIWIRVERPYSYSYKSFTREEYRGQRISPVVHLYSDNEMFHRDYRFRIGFVAVTNYASLEMGKHMGSTILGYAGYFSLFGKLFPIRSNAVKKTGFTFFKP